MTPYNGISHNNDITHPPAAADPDHENVLTLSRALNFPLWRDGTLSIIKLFIKGLPQLAKAVRVRCSPTRISLCQSVPGGTYAMLHSSSMSTRRDSRLTCSLPILQACRCTVSICDGLTEEAHTSAMAIIMIVQRKHISDMIMEPPTRSLSSGFMSCSITSNYHTCK